MSTSPAPILTNSVFKDLPGIRHAPERQEGRGGGGGGGLSVPPPSKVWKQGKGL